MTDPDFPVAPLLFILGLLSGFACAIWLAVALDQDARAMAERTDQPEPIEHG